MPKFNFPCKGCEIVVQNNEALMHHQTTCLKLQIDPSKPNSFLGQARKLFPVEEQPTPTLDKLTVLSQSPGQTYAAAVSSPGSGNSIPRGARSNPTPATSNTLNAPPLPIDEENAPPVPSQGEGVGIVNNQTGDEAIEEDDPNCPLCREEVEHRQQGIACDSCKLWYHRPCLYMTDEVYQELSASEESWFCMRCLAIKGNRIKWGEMEGEESIKKCTQNTYKNTYTHTRKLQAGRKISFCYQEAKLAQN